VRHLTLTGLVLAIVLTALGVGHARGQAPVAGHIVLCVGTQIVTVSVDENGQPTTATLTCPDAIVSLSVPLVAPVVLDRPVVVARTQTTLSVPLFATSVSPMEVRARAPPVRA
jgi:hypothetical protein